MMSCLEPLLSPVPWSSIHLTVFEVLRHIHSEEDLKSCRLVSKHWLSVTDQFFYKPKIRVGFPLRLSDQDCDDDVDKNRCGSSSLAVTKRNAISSWQDKVEAFGGFVTGWGNWRSKFPISHLIIENENRLASDSYQKICSDLLSEIGPTLNTLDIRFSSGNVRKDLLFFKDILQKASNLTGLCINFNMWRTKGRISVEDAADLVSPHPKLKRLKLCLLFSHFQYFKSSIASINNFVLNGVPPNFHEFLLRTTKKMYQHCQNVHILFSPFTELEALSVSLESSPYGLICPHQFQIVRPTLLPTTLKELHLEPAVIMSIPCLGEVQPLRRLRLWYPAFHSEHFRAICVMRHKDTLTELEIKCLPWLRRVFQLISHRVPVFQELRKLTYIIDTAAKGEEEDPAYLPYTPAYYDLLCLQHFFKARTAQLFSRRFPALTEIVLEFGRWKFYDQLIPKRQLENPRLRQVLKVRVTLEERDKEEFEETLKKRLYSLFPNASQDVVIVPSGGQCVAHSHKILSM